MSAGRAGRGRQRRRQALAAVVTVAGALAIWTFASMRQGEQTEALSRQWVGEQWDVARQCFVGTPIGRGEGEAAIATKLEARLIEALAEASEADETEDPRTPWPARCVPRLADLRVDPSILDADPTDAIATLEVLAPRVIRAGPDGPGAFAVGEAAERARELAAPIAALDEAMPPGAEYDVSRYAAATPTAPPSEILASLACPVARTRRPFFAASLGEATLHDELETEDRSLRLTGDRGAFTLATASAAGTATRALDPHGTAPRFWDAQTLLWLADGTLMRAPIEGPPEVAIPIGVEASAMALCRAGAVAHVLLRTADGARWVRVDGDAASPPVRVNPSPPDAGVVLACSPSTVALAWPGDDGWVGTRCTASACGALPSLAAGGDLQLAVHGDDVLAVARGRRTDLSLARRLEGDAWSDPTPVLRGTLRVADGAYVLASCDGAAHASAGGDSWTPLAAR